MVIGEPGAKQLVERLAHIVNVRTAENEKLVEQHARQLGRTVTPLRPWLPMVAYQTLSG